MRKPDYIELGDGQQLPILYEDRSVIAIDKPRGWMLVPYNWQRTSWNLQAALDSAIREGRFWARSRNLKFLRHIHRLDAETTGVLLLAKSLGAVDSYSELFESRRMEKLYLAVVQGAPRSEQWTSRLAVAPDPKKFGKMRSDPKGKPAETEFKVLQKKGGRTLVEARPITGRTHQIRVHLAESGVPIIGDPLYGTATKRSAEVPLGLRSVLLAYRDPFTKRMVRIEAAREEFVREFGFGED